MKYVFSLMALMAIMTLISLSFFSVAWAAQPEQSSFALMARVSDRSRAQEVRLEGRPDLSVLGKSFRVSKEDVQLELIPRSRGVEGLTLFYKVSKKGVAFSEGEFVARAGQKTQLLAGDKKGGNLLNLAIRIPGENIPYGAPYGAPYGKSHPLLLRESLERTKRYVPI